MWKIFMVCFSGLLSVNFYNSSWGEVQNQHILLTSINVIALKQRPNVTKGWFSFVQCFNFQAFWPEFTKFQSFHGERFSTGEKKIGRKFQNQDHAFLITPFIYFLSLSAPHYPDNRQSRSSEAFTPCKELYTRQKQ